MRGDYEIMLLLLAVIAFNTCDGCGCSCGDSDTKQQIQALDTKVDKLNKRLDTIKCPP